MINRILGLILLLLGFFLVFVFPGAWKTSAEQIKQFSYSGIALGIFLIGIGIYLILVG